MSFTGKSVISTPQCESGYLPSDSEVKGGINEVRDKGRAISQTFKNISSGREDMLMTNSARIGAIDCTRQSIKRGQCFRGRCNKD